MGRGSATQAEQAMRWVVYTHRSLLTRRASLFHGDSGKRLPIGRGMAEDARKEGMEKPDASLKGADSRPLPSS